MMCTRSCLFRLPSMSKHYCAVDLAEPVLQWHTVLYAPWVQTSKCSGVEHNSLRLRGELDLFLSLHGKGRRFPKEWIV